MKEQHSALSRPAAAIGADGGLDIRASAAMGCRRALWYAATGHAPTNPPADDAVTAMEVGKALEPVVAAAMRRAGWEISPSDQADPERVSVGVAPNLVVSGHPDATGRMPVFGGEEVIVEIKTRGPAAFKRWQSLGAEISHPDSVAQAAVYSQGRFGEARHVVIATMDTGSRTWDYELIPAPRVAAALARVRGWLTPLAGHLAAAGPDPDALPERDFAAGSWRCAGCPFLAVCRPGDVVSVEEEADPEVGFDEARAAVGAYTDAQEAMRGPERAKRKALATLRAYMLGSSNGKESIGDRTVSLVRTRRFSVNHRRLNELLDPETRAEVVTESASEHVRIT